MSFIINFINITILVLVLKFEIVFSLPYGTTNAASSSADLVIGFDLSSSSGSSNLIHNSASYAYENDRKIVEVRRVSTNEVESRNNYGRQTDINSNSALPGDKYQQNEIKGQQVPVRSDGHQRAIPPTGTNVNAVTGLDNDAIIFPDSVAKYAPKDSYGNPVTPYTTLPDEPVSIPTDTSSQIGHKTDVNRDEGVIGNDNIRPNTNVPSSQNSANLRPQVHSSQNSQNHVPTSLVSSHNPETLGFILPSYASGITKLETFSSGTVTARPSIPRPNSNLLPPLSSGNYNYPQLNIPSKPINKTTNTEHNNPSSGNHQNNFASQTPNSQSHSRINTDSYQPQNNDNSRNTGYSQTTNSQSYPSQTQTTPVKPPNYDEAIIFPTLEPPRLGSVSTYDSGHAVVIPVSNPRHIQANQQVAISYPSPNHGHSVQNESPRSSSSVSSYQGTQISQQPQTVQAQHSSTNYRSSVQNDAPQNSAGTNYHVNSNTQQTAAPHSTTNYRRPVENAPQTERYSGGFGGAPGVLSPYDSNSLNTRPTTLNVHTNIPTVRPHVQTNSQNTGAYSSVNQKALTTGTGNITTRTYQQHQPQPTVSHYSTPTKYEGSFGGSPGVLSPFDNVKKN